MQYQYRPLETTQHSIRLITLLPRREDGDIALTLQQVKLAEVTNRYAALSYTWGEDKPSKRVWIDGHWTLLRDNLWSFLNHCCNSTFKNRAPIKLWIDAICIDQDNFSEKSSQVKLMGDIFRSATEVLIWLGSDSEQSLLVEVFKRYRAAPANQDRFDSQVWSDFAQYASDILDHNTLQEVQQIAAHNYWQRVWIIQEILLARSPFVVLSDLTVNLDDIHELRKKAIAKVYGSFPPSDSFEPLPHWSALNHVLNFWGVTRQAQYDPFQRRWSLDYLLSLYCVRQCSDIRDRVYSLVGLCKSLNDLEVNYSCTKEELAVQTFFVWRQELKAKTGRSFGSTTAKMYLDHLMTALNLAASDFLKLVPLLEQDKDDYNDFSYIVCLDGRFWIDLEHPRYLNRETSLD